MHMADDVRKTVTIRDVAVRAGVSVATVSRALNGRGYVSSEAKQRVFGAAKELGYKPHAPARSLKLQRTETVGLMIADITSPFYSELADGVLVGALSKSLSENLVSIQALPTQPTVFGYALSPIPFK